MSEVALKVGGHDYRGWKEIRIQRGMTQIAGEFTLRLADRWHDQAKRLPLRPGQDCQVLVDGQPVISGIIDEATPRYSATEHGIEVRGRDATGQLVDCAAPSFQWKGRDLLSGAKELCKPFGIPVTADVDVGKPFERIKADEGETVFEVIETAARIRAVLLMADGLGGLQLTRVSSQRLPGRLELGVNIKEGSATESIRERFSTYKVKGQKAGMFDDASSTATGVQASADDAQIKRYRPTLILADGPVDIADCQTRAIWHRNVAAAKSLQAQYVAPAWDIEGQLFRPNRLIPVRDPYLGIDRELVIASVALVLDAKGRRAELALALPEAFSLAELPEPVDDSELFA